MKIELFYDKECPFCNSYANYVKLKQKHTLILQNAREAKDKLNKYPLDINDGFIIVVDDKKVLQGVDAIVFLNKIARKKIFFPENSFFRYFVYPTIKFFRKIFLLILKKDMKI
ncbi:MAG: DCC1-like thiol-disulfide oxidoreductase family protein [Sphaerochaetaceae bacterium]|nr:DCC1-like thiol-disulfide oxidoreductase family protein [Sphaerochaetaceae bacterium]